mmetsp:Transcript_28182/g.71520  ORF Transcript_28182/g.71520 Transcript_28182/m.71520 type:complete len:348 (+) Transcript_28182:1068-2111(+)
MEWREHADYDEARRTTRRQQADGRAPARTGSALPKREQQTGQKLEREKTRVRAQYEEYHAVGDAGGEATGGAWEEGHADSGPTKGEQSERNRAVSETKREAGGGKPRQNNQNSRPRIEAEKAGRPVRDVVAAEVRRHGTESGRCRAAAHPDPAPTRRQVRRVQHSGTSEPAPVPHARQVQSARRLRRGRARVGDAVEAERQGQGDRGAAGQYSQLHREGHRNKNQAAGPDRDEAEVRAPSGPVPVRAEHRELAVGAQAGRGGGGKGNPPAADGEVARLRASEPGIIGRLRTGITGYFAHSGSRRTGRRERAGNAEFRVDDAEIARLRRNGIRPGARKGGRSQRLERT